ncbi:hypothetical protein PENTCL1PPCAC_27966, partial [Pristionchus entomophagus]
QMSDSQRRQIELKLERLQGHLRSHKVAIVENEKKPNDMDMQRIVQVQKQLETSLDNLLAEVDSQSDIRMNLTRLKQELVSLHTRISNIQNKKNHFTEDNDYIESNIYEEEAQSQMMQQQQKREGMAELAREVKEKAEVTQQLERDIRDIEAIFSDLNNIVHEQGEMIDSIEESVESATNDVQRGQRDLRKAVDAKGRTSVMTAAVVGGVVVGGPAGVAASSAIVGVLGAVGGVVTGFYGANWFKRQAKKDAQEQ